MPDRRTRDVALPFVKWAGGKSQILPEIRLRYPKGLGTTITKYAEPFVGGGAVLFDVLSHYEIEEIFIGDLNSVLILAYATIRDDPESLVLALRELEEKYLPASQEARKAMFYEKREKFNALKGGQVAGVELAALFIFLNRLCFNGLYRVNSKGEFNVPHGRYKRPRICDANNLRAVSRALKGANVVHGDYRISRDFIDERSFVYFDPPYRPLSETANFTSYDRTEFGDREQRELAEFILEMSERGAYIVASNSDPKNVNENDDFFDLLYAKFSISRIEATRAINSVAEGRGRLREILITNAKDSG